MLFLLKILRCGWYGYYQVTPPVAITVLVQIAAHLNTVFPYIKILFVIN